jgi:heme exporter protein B
MHQLKVLLGQGLKAELAEKQRLVSPLLFGATILILFSFAMGEIPSFLVSKMFLAQTFLTILFALQASFVRTFEPDQKDKVFELLQTYPINPSAWFLSKYILVLGLGSAIVFPTMLLAGLLMDTSGVKLLQPFVFAAAFLGLTGLTSLGVLLSAATLKASGREIIFPLLYFPLSTPILLSAIESSLAYFENSSSSGQWIQWLILLVCFNVISFTLGLLLFGELVDS